jgi:hypothetical protein
VQARPASIPPPPVRFPQEPQSPGAAQLKRALLAPPPLRFPGQAAPAAPPSVQPRKKHGCTGEDCCESCSRRKTHKKRAAGLAVQPKVIQKVDSDSDYEPMSDDEPDCESAYVDDDCDVLDQYNIRGTFYPAGYRAATLVWKNAQLVLLQDTCGAGNYRCPGCAVCKANATSTIDHHPTAVSEHWNDTGHDQDQAQRADWYNDTTNHRIRCGPCNHGGVLYDRHVGPNFRGPNE